MNFCSEFLREIFKHWLKYLVHSLTHKSMFKYSIIACETLPRVFDILTEPSLSDS